MCNSNSKGPVGVARHKKKKCLKLNNKFSLLYIYIYVKNFIHLNGDFFSLPHPLSKHPCFRGSDIQGVAFDNGIGVHDALGHFNLQELAAQTL
jgi:hypothetical protein